MLVCNSQKPWDRITYLPDIASSSSSSSSSSDSHSDSSSKCIPIPSPGPHTAGLRPTNELWCTIFKSDDCSVDFSREMETQKYVGLETPGVRRWDDERDWWRKELGKEWWFPGSFMCWRKGERQVGLVTGEHGEREG
jgi:hypothetical protein